MGLFDWFGTSREDKTVVELLNGILDGREDCRAPAITLIDQLRNKKKISANRKNIFDHLIVAIEKRDEKAITSTPAATQLSRS